MDEFIPFNKPHLTGNEIHNLEEAIKGLKLSGDGMFNRKCQSLLEKRYGFNKVFLTTSCTDALEACALLIDTKAGDEIIIPSYTFVSTANAFVLRGAKIVFTDSEESSPNMDIGKIESLITAKTKAIVCVHYAGIACDMSRLMALATKYNLFVIEDAAHAIDGFCMDKPLGSIGHLAAFSFHETKNITCGEGGMLVINDFAFVERAEIILEKGTNRKKFLRGETESYEWMDVGSSYQLSNMLAAFLFAQLEGIDTIQNKRKENWNCYNTFLKPMQEKGFITLPKIPEYSSNNAHIFFVICNSKSERNELIKFLHEKNIHTTFHYLSLHQSEFYKGKHDGRELRNSDKFTDCLLRLPLFYDLQIKDIENICVTIQNHFERKITA